MGRKIFIADADLIGKNRHRFPNLTCMKIAMSHLELGDEIIRVKKWEEILQKGKDDWAYISKVFTDTYVPDFVLQHMDESPENFYIGGTGFYFDKAEMLPDYMEHSMPYYEYYDGLAKGEYYKDYSIGFLTRGCFRHCPFCVNKNKTKSVPWAPVKEFYRKDKKYLCFLDDNFFACRYWKPILQEVIDLGVPYQFKQGLDERLLDDEKCEMLFNSKYHGAVQFAFDNIEDAPIIEEKLNLIRKYTNTQNLRFYVLVGFRSTDAKDIANAFERIRILGKYGAFPYIMRYKSQVGAPYKKSPLKSIYVNLARWVNMPQFFKKMSFHDFCELDQSYKKTDKMCSSLASCLQFEKDYPEIAKKYFFTKPWEVWR